MVHSQRQFQERQSQKFERASRKMRSVSDSRAMRCRQQSLKKNLKSRYIAFRYRTLPSRPANLHQCRNAQRCVSNRNLAAENRCLPKRTWGYEAQTALADILHLSCHRKDLRILFGAELWQFPDNYLKELGKSRFLTPVGLGDAFHVQS